MMIEQYTKGNGFDKAKKFTAAELAEELGYNLDQCGYPHVEEEILAPMDLIQRYQEERSSLNAEIDRVLSEIMEKLKGNLSCENTGGFSRDKLPFGTTKVSDKEMR